MLTFLKSEQLGILENTLLDACLAATRRKRQVALNSARRVLIELKLLERGIGPFGIGRGVNALGEQGFWIIPEANFASAKKAEPHVSVEAKGPQAKDPDGPCKDYSTNGYGVCVNCGHSAHKHGVE